MQPDQGRRGGSPKNTGKNKKGGGQIGKRKKGED